MEQNLEEYKKAIETRDKQLADAKKEYIANIKQRLNQY